MPPAQELGADRLRESVNLGIAHDPLAGVPVARNLSGWNSAAGGADVVLGGVMEPRPLGLESSFASPELNTSCSAPALVYLLSLSGFSH